jgi:MOSC domain-containing protein YiiM
MAGAVREAADLNDCVMPLKGIFARVIKGGEIARESYCYYDL